MFDSTGQGIIVTDQNKLIVSVNPAFTAVTGYTEEDVIGHNPSMLSAGKHDASYYEKMWAQINEKGMWQGEIWNRRKNGEEYLQLLTINAVTDDSDEIVRYVGTFSDMTDMAEITN